MSLKLCPIQDICVNYRGGGRLPPNHDVRNKKPCKKFIDMSCELSVAIQVEAMGLVLACDISKRRKA